MKKIILFLSLITAFAGYGQDTDQSKIDEKGKYPFHKGSQAAMTNKAWWPNQLRLNILRQRSSLSNPMEECLIMLKNSTLDSDALKKDIFDYNDRFTGLVASRLRALRSVFYPYGLA